MNFSCLVIMEKEAFRPNLQNKLKKIVANYCSNKKVEPYIALPYIELLERFNEFSKDHLGEGIFLDEFAIKWSGFDYLDKDMNAISTFNSNSKMDNYNIGGTFRGILTDIYGNYPSIALAKEIDWDKTINSSYKRTLRDWRTIQKDKKISLIDSLYNLRKDDCRETYVHRETYTFIHAVIDKSEKYHVVGDCNNFNEWENKIYSPFIKDLNEDDVIVLIDCIN